MTLFHHDFGVTDAMVEKKALNINQNTAWNSIVMSFFGPNSISYERIAGLVSGIAQKLSQSWERFWNWWNWDRIVFILLIFEWIEIESMVKCCERAFHGSVSLRIAHASIKSSPVASATSRPTESKSPMASTFSRSVSKLFICLLVKLLISSMVAPVRSFVIAGAS